MDTVDLHWIPHAIYGTANSPTPEDPTIMTTTPFSLIRMGRTNGQKVVSFHVPYVTATGQVIAHRYNSGERTPPMFPRGESSGTLVLDITRGLQGASPKYVVMQDKVVKTEVKDAEGKVTGEVISLPDNILEKLKAKIMAIPVKNSDHTEAQPSISYPWRLATPEETLSAKEDGMDAALTADLNSVLSAHGLNPRSAATPSGPAPVASPVAQTEEELKDAADLIRLRADEKSRKEEARLTAEKAALREEIKAEIAAEIAAERSQQEKVQAEQKEMADLRAENARLKAKKGTGSTPE